jgi:hypothetical protein
VVGVRRFILYRMAARGRSKFTFSFKKVTSSVSLHLQKLLRLMTELVVWPVILKFNKICMSYVMLKISYLRRFIKN